MFERFTDRARQVMALANQEAQRLNHEYIGTEHILLGLLKEGRGVGANVLMNLEISLDALLAEVQKLVAGGPDPGIRLGKLPQAPRAKKVIELAIAEARALNHNYVGTEHLLLGLLREQEGIACQALGNLGVTLEVVRDETRSLLGVASESTSAADRSSQEQSPSEEIRPVCPYPVCGHANEPRARFCCRCGRSLEAGVEDLDAQSGPTPGQVFPLTLKVISAFILGLLLGSVLLGLLAKN